MTERQQVRIDSSLRTSREKGNLEEPGPDGSSILKWLQSVQLQRGSFVLLRPCVIENRVNKNRIISGKNPTPVF